ncbi:MAG TPA: FAD-dependent oxidoreductase [Candidatus Limnocylindria bacterium]|jgi:monoamine oxidase|nr:FAD-dependent oxidoreductase [Candidatus Limnocylindria bacterium]
MNPSIPRRNFVKLSLLATASMLARRKLRAGPLTASPATSADVIVIGAGMAGVSAAYDLQQYGLKVIVLEGRTRIGGRMWSNRLWPDDPVDLGAQWIIRSDSNPLRALARSLDLQVVPTNLQGIFAYDYDGRQLDDLTVATIAGTYQALVEQLYAMRAERQARGEPDISLQEAVDLAVQGQPLTDEDRRRLNFALAGQFEGPYATEASKFSFYAFGENDNESDREVMMPKGYDQLPNLLARGLDVRLGRIVQKIEHGGDRAQVTTAFGEVLEADHVIVTLPLGVLRAGSVEFSPVLPPEKLGAINRLQMGVVNKLFLRFPEQFWPVEPDFIGYVNDTRRQWVSWVNFTRETATTTPILEAINAGDFARGLEDQPIEDVVAQAMKALRVCFGPSIPDPVDWIRSTWGSDPFCRGSYSYVPVGATPADYDLMAQPVGQRLLFAGEATSRLYPSSVHGAYLSGKREATRVLERKGLLPAVKLSTVRDATGEVEVSWPSNAPGYVLQFKDDLNAPNWGFSTTPPVTRGSNFVVKDLGRAEGRFYRLAR